MTVTALTAFEEGVVVGLLVGEGHFGGDGRKPQVTVRMHVRHEALMRWLHARFPRSRLYGPYHHGDRHYFQWMVRGRALSEDLMPILDRHVQPELDAHAHARVEAMRERYPRSFERDAEASPDSAPRAAAPDPAPREPRADAAPARPGRPGSPRITP